MVKGKSSLLTFCKRCTAQMRKNFTGIEWGYSTIFATFSSSTAGVAILFNNNFQFQILKHFTDPKGRFIIAAIDTGDKTMTLVNVYEPNKDNPAFLETCVTSCAPLNAIL